jgi:hypothetical protein
VLPARTCLPKYRCDIVHDPTMLGVYEHRLTIQLRVSGWRRMHMPESHVLSDLVPLHSFSGRLRRSRDVLPIPVHAAEAAVIPFHPDVVPLGHFRGLLLLRLWTSSLLSQRTSCGWMTREFMERRFAGGHSHVLV